MPLFVACSCCLLQVVGARWLLSFANPFGYSTRLHFSYRMGVCMREYDPKRSNFLTLCARVARFCDFYEPLISMKRRLGYKTAQNAREACEKNEPFVCCGQGVFCCLSSCLGIDDTYSKNPLKLNLLCFCKFQIAH